MTTHTVFLLFFIFVALAPTVPVVEDRNVIQRRRINMTSFVTLNVQTTVVSFFLTSLKKTSGENDIVNI